MERELCGRTDSHSGLDWFRLMAGACGYGSVVLEQMDAFRMAREFLRWREGWVFSDNR